MELIEKVIKKVEEYAEEQAYDAAMEGAMNDGGRSRTLDSIKFYRCGLDNQIPVEWEGFIKEINREEDPEYKYYLKLKEKFE
jgi:hypothetical protein